LVNLHGGSIQAYSGGLGKGTEFLVRLPILTGEIVVESDPTVSTKPQRALKMLIVDDNEDSAETMAMLQELYGHRTMVAHTGPKAITAALEFLPDVVLLDIGLPEMDGFQVARKLRTIPEIQDAFLVALTGYGTDEDRVKAKEAGFDEHLAKPANLELLREWIRARF
jgi:two-component system CheB/CheR fusion protein